MHISLSNYGMQAIQMISCHDRTKFLPLFTTHCAVDYLVALLCSRIDNIATANVIKSVNW